MSIALVMTVRDEVEFLRQNLLYHRFLGVERRTSTTTARPMALPTASPTCRSCECAHRLAR